MSDSVKQAQMYESLSALVDNEASELEVHRLLAESEKDAGVRARWYRYQLARAALRGDVVSIEAVGIADAVRSAVDNLSVNDEPSELVPADTSVHGAKALSEDQPAKSPWLSGWRANLGRVAIAASVATVVVLISQQMNNLNGGAALDTPVAERTEASKPMEAVAQPEPATQAIDSPLPAVNLQTVSSNPNAGQRSQLPQQGLQYSPTAQQQHLQDAAVRLYIQQLMLEHAEHAAQNTSNGMLPFARTAVEHAE